MPRPKYQSTEEMLQMLSTIDTVAKAYRDLEVMGLLYTRRGMGVFINKGIEAKCREDVRRRIVMRLHEVTAEAKAAGLTQAETVDLVQKSYKSDSNPYGPTPPSLFSSAKGAKKRTAK